MSVSRSSTHVPDVDLVRQLRNRRTILGLSFPDGLVRTVRDQVAGQAQVAPEGVEVGVPRPLRLQAVEDQPREPGVVELDRVVDLGVRGRHTDDAPGRELADGRPLGTHDLLRGLGEVRHELGAYGGPIPHVEVDGPALLQGAAELIVDPGLPQDGDGRTQPHVQWVLLELDLALEAGDLPEVVPGCADEVDELDVGGQVVGREVTEGFRHRHLTEGSRK